MPVGKLAAQVAHASLAAITGTARRRTPNRWQRVWAKLTGKKALDVMEIPLTPEIAPWLEGKFTKICGYVDSEAALVAAHKKALELGIPCSLIEDSGLTVFNGIPTLTVAAIGPAPNEVVDLVTKKLKLLK